MENFKKIELPIKKSVLSKLRAGDYVLLSGRMYTGRDAAHKRLTEALRKGEKLPFDLKDESIFYVGPCFDSHGRPTAAGPTTSMRMDAYAPLLYDAGLSASIGKGDRDGGVYEAVKRNGAVYFAAVGGAGAVYADSIQSVKTVCYEDLGTEAVYEFTVKEFPVIVAVDSQGGSIYK